MSFSVNYIYDIVDKYSDKIKKITANTEKFIKTIDIANGRLRVISNTTEKYGKKLNKTNACVNKFNTTNRKMGDQATKTSKQVKGMGSNVFATGAVIGMAFVNIRNAILYPIKAGMAFQVAMADLQKSAKDIKTPNQLKEMANEIFKISKELGIVPAEMAKIGTASSKMGIKMKNLPDFMRLTGQASIAFDVNSDEAGIMLGKIKNKFDLSIDGIKKVLDAINFTADQSAVQSKDLLNVIDRAAIGMESWNFTPAFTVALSTAAMQISPTRQQAGTGIRRTVQKLGEHPAYAARMKLDPQGTFLKVFEGLNKKFNTGKVEEANEFIKAMWGSGRNAAFARNLSMRLNLLHNSMKLVSDESKYLNSMFKELQLKIATVQFKVNKLNAVWTQLCIILSDALLPMLKNMLIFLIPIIEKIKSFAKHHPNVVKVVAALMIVSAILLVIMGSFIAINILITAMNWLLMSSALIYILWATAIIAIIALIITIIVYWKEVLTWIINLWRMMYFVFKYFWNKIISYLKTKWKNIVNFLKNSWKQIISQWKSDLVGIVKPFKDLCIWSGNLFKSIGVWIYDQFIKIYSGIKRIKEFFGFGHDEDTMLDESAKNAILNTKQTTYVGGGIDINVIGPGRLTRAVLKASNNKGNNGLNMPSLNGQLVPIN